MDQNIHGLSFQSGSCLFKRFPFNSKSGMISILKNSLRVKIGNKSLSENSSEK